jgi:NAD(P)-dependent dehydrogenase (short-subunit alcohol dehydrogenase family)
MSALPGVYHDRYHQSWINRTGPGDARPTALQVVKDEDLVGKLGNLVVVVTGCSSGIGIETVRAIHATGATVFATARKPAALAEVVTKIENEDSNKAPIHQIIMDLESFDSVRKAAAEILEKSGGKVNIIINNAGVMATPAGKTKDGWETQFGTNHLAHYLLFQLLKPALLASSTPEFNSRVVNVSSIGHRYGPVHLGDYNFEKPGNEYTPWLGYGQSKTANIWMASEITRRYGSKGLWGISLHPGGIMTPLAKHLDASVLDRWSAPDTQKYMKSPEQGAATQTIAAIGREFEGRGVFWLSNCEEYGPVSDDVAAAGPAAALGIDGYHPHAKDEAGAKQLWVDSAKIVGVTED